MSLIPTSKVDLPLILVQDLTYVNGDIIALYVGENKSFFIERWIDRVGGWDVFLLVKVKNAILLNYLENLNTLYLLTIEFVKGPFYIKQVKGKEVHLQVLYDCDIHEKLRPKHELQPKEVRFITNEKYNKIHQIIHNKRQPSSGPSFQDLCSRFNFDPPQNWGDPNP